RRQRRRFGRWLMYAISIVAVVAFALVADWDKIRFSFFQADVLKEMLPEVLLIAARNTLVYTAGAFTFGLVLALILALMKLSTIKPYRWFATGYIELFRGLPALITIILFGYGLPLAFQFHLPGGTLVTGSVALGVVAAAYMAETIRAGILAVPKGQDEAARSLGMSPARAMGSIVLPQAFRIIIPPLTNEFVLLIKDTSLLFVLGTTPVTKELTKFARDFMSTTQNATPLTVVAIVYLIITLPLTYLVRRLEKRTAKAR
ncbi:MAG: amino acid ABC transporter permease, partial [Acidimicrobiia bacterium]